MGPEALHPVTAVASGQPKRLSGRCQILPDVTWEVASPPSGPVASKAHTLPRGAVCSANQDPQDGREVKVWSSQEVHMGLKRHHSERVRYSGSCGHVTRGHTVMVTLSHLFFIWDYFLFFYFYLVVIISLNYE